MYTQCLKCETVFKLSAETLRTAGGQVRCGKCGEVFNALARLAEDEAAFESGESPLDLETRADSILESVAPVQAPPESADSDSDSETDDEDADRPGVEVARLEILDFPEDEQASTTAEDRSLEFTLPPGELDRIFIERKKATLKPSPPEAVPHPETAPHPEAAPHPETAPQPAAAPHPESLDDVALPARNRVSGFEVPEAVRRDMLAGFDEHIQPALDLQGEARRTASPRRLLMWLGGAVFFTVLLLVQIVHQNREWFVAHTQGTLGGVVRGLYRALGAPLPQPANFSAYQLRQWGVTGEPDANGTLKLRASILNATAQVQPYPLLRLTLADRFGKSVGRRDFEPGEYVGKPTAGLLAPGERVDAILAILDPGKDAEGFEIDVCLRGVDRKISCASDVAAQRTQ